MRQLRATRYDLAIDPTPYSTSGRLLLSLTRARFRLGFSLPSQWAALTPRSAVDRRLPCTRDDNRRTS
ncbi:MAG: hypothetical protein WDM77_19525 [Steroidobacteraceae bacterium]